VVPAIDLANTSGFLATVDPGIARERVILIDNTDDSSIGKRHFEEVRAVHAHGRNLGVSASWNLGARSVLCPNETDYQVLGLDRPATFVTFCSTSIRFNDAAGGLCRTADLAAENHQWLFGFESCKGWHLITFGKATFDAVGWVDENFWPGYFNDNDMIRRMRLAGIMEPAGGDRALRQFPWVGALNPGLVGDAEALKHCGIEWDRDANLRYYIDKWGREPGGERFELPFNDPANLLSYWPATIKPEMDGDR